MPSCCNYKSVINELQHGHGTYEVKHVLDEEVPHESVFKEKELSQRPQVIEQSTISDEYIQQILIDRVVLAFDDVVKCLGDQE